MVHGSLLCDGIVLGGRHPLTAYCKIGILGFVEQYRFP